MCRCHPCKPDLPAPSAPSRPAWQACGDTVYETFADVPQLLHNVETGDWTTPAIPMTHEALYGEEERFILEHRYTAHGTRAMVRAPPSSVCRGMQTAAGRQPQ